MRRCIYWYIDSIHTDVVDLGLMNVNGSYRDLLPDGIRYTGVDLTPGHGVDVVLEDAYSFPFDDNSIDLVMSGQMLEHCGQFWRVFQEVERILRPGGLAFMIAPSAGPVHRYPVDCYRFYPDSYQAIADWARLRLVHSWTDERGPWRDIVGVFQKGGDLQAVTGPRPMRIAANAQITPHADPAVERRQGARPYRAVLRDLHALIQPDLYLEIGVRRGHSLDLAAGCAIAIDPDPHEDFVVKRDDVRFFRCSSDDGFFFHSATAFRSPVQLAFIDGMHWAEYVLRDIMNVERVMAPDGVIVVDDVLPNHPVQARRERQSQVWTGDVWRAVALLASVRPDLHLTWLNTEPTGLLLISALNPHDRRLWDDYNSLARSLADRQGDVPPIEILERRRAVEPTIEAIKAATGR